MNLPPDLVVIRLNSDGGLKVVKQGIVTGLKYCTDCLYPPNCTDDGGGCIMSSNCYENQLLTAIKGQLESWVDELGSHSAKAQGLKESITSYSKFIRGSFRPHSPHKNADSIYFLLKLPPSVGKTDPQAIGFVRIGARNLFFEHQGQLVNVPQCVSILDFYVSQQRQGFGYILLSHVIKEKAISIDQLAFDRPTLSMLSFLSKHFNLNRPRKQHNRFVIFDDFFRSED